MRDRNYLASNNSGSRKRQPLRERKEFPAPRPACAKETVPRRSRNCAACKAAGTERVAARIVQGKPLCTPHASAVYVPAPGWSGIGVAVRAKERTKMLWDDFYDDDKTLVCPSGAGMCE